MMNERGRSRDLQHLSQYLDSRLNETQTRKLEARLAQDAALRERLENLRKTKLMLSRLSRVRAPRNFTLSPEMVKVRRKQRHPLTLAMRWATTVAAILLVVLFGADLLFKGPILARSSLQEAAPAMEAMTLSEDMAANAEPTPEPLILWGAPNAPGRGGGDEAEAFGLGGGGTGAVEEPITEAPVPIDEVPEEAPPGPVEATPQDTETFSKGTGESPILGLNPDQGGEIVSTSEAPAAAESAAWLSNLSVLNWVEIALAVIILASGMTWLILRKR
jgi:hypothetical protein